MTSLLIRHWLLENVKVLNIAGGDFVKHLFQRFVHNVAHNLKQNDLEDVRSTAKGVYRLAAFIVSDNTNNLVFVKREHSELW